MDYRERNDVLTNIYLEYANEVYHFARSLTKNSETAKDLMHKAFMQYLLHMTDGNIEYPKAYLFRTVRNLAYNLTRDTKYEAQEEELDVLDDMGRVALGIDYEYVEKEETMERKLFCNSIMDHVREHNEEWYDVLNKVYCLDIPQEEVAEELGISRDALYSKLRRARDWVRKNYEKEYNDIT